jgi:hypothetical protein
VDTVVRGGGDVLPRFGKAVVCVVASVPCGGEGMMHMTDSPSWCCFQRTSFGYPERKDRH